MIMKSLESFSLDAKRLVSFPLEDKHAVNKHHVARKSLDATQKKMSSYSAFQSTMCLKQTCCIINIKAAKKFVGVAVYWEE